MAAQNFHHLSRSGHRYLLLLLPVRERIDKVLCFVQFLCMLKDNLLSPCTVDPCHPDMPGKILSKIKDLSPLPFINSLFGFNSIRLRMGASVCAFSTDKSSLSYGPVSILSCPSPTLQIRKSHIARQQSGRYTDPLSGSVLITEQEFFICTEAILSPSFISHQFP